MAEPELASDVQSSSGQRRVSRQPSIEASVLEASSEDDRISRYRRRDDRWHPNRSRSPDEISADGRGRALNDSEPPLFIQDHLGRQYMISFRLGKTWSNLVSLLHEIYERRDDQEHLEDIRNDRYDMVLKNRVILPSVWETVVSSWDTVRVSFWSNEDVSVSRGRHMRSSYDELGFADIEIDSRGHIRRGSDSSRGDYRDRIARSPGSSDQEEDREEGDDVDAVTEEDDETAEPPTPQPVRAVIAPIDQEGNGLSFTINTRWLRGQSQPDKEKDNTSETLTRPAKTQEMTMETIKITKAITATTEGRTALQVHTLPGPDNPTFQHSIGIRWYHLYGMELNWAQFKRQCLSIPALSDSVQKLIAKTLWKVEKEKLKAFLEGMFIEPGTIIRGDESSRGDPHSVIFSCIPYFDIRKPLKGTVGQGDRLHPPRTLIQSYYPYEPVRDRDKEQAYQKFGNGGDGGLIHVPSLWMLNIDSKTVVTCGYRPLSSEFVKSIEVLQEDLKQLGTSTRTETPLTNIRLSDGDGRVLLYSLDECQTYFEMEQKLRELKCYSRHAEFEPTTQMSWLSPDGEKKVTPANWQTIIQRRDLLFIDLSVNDENKATGTNDDVPGLQSLQTQIHSPKNLIPPFFHWPSSIKDDETAPGFIPQEIKRAIRCLELVEKAMLNDTLPEYDTSGPVDETFTSTKYYENLEEDTFEHVRTCFPSVSALKTPTNMSHRSFHEAVMQAQYSKLENKMADFVGVVNETLSLFVSDVDKSVLLRKVWGAMAHVAAKIGRITEHSPYKRDPKEYGDPSWKSPMCRTRSWRIRTPASKDSFTTPGVPDKDSQLAESIKGCQQCMRKKPFKDPQAALQHLREHANLDPPESSNAKSGTFIVDDETLKDWIRNSDENLLETISGGALTILDHACKMTGHFLIQLQELADGVKNEQGKISEVYTFPRKLLETMRRLIIFYLSIERSLHYTQETFDNSLQGLRQNDVPYSKAGLDVLSRFSDGVNTSLLQVRIDLCDMARSAAPYDYWKRLSLGPEYICAWFIRRLIVKPLTDSMTVGDMYREYLSTLQFQVNHRPGKRLLRSINLLQEELTILALVNDWQTRLVENYTAVLDDATYPTDIPSRRALFPYERLILNSCLENLALSREEYAEQIRRCGPLSDSTKQSAEINEEDHGKAILVFTVVTIIFLPLSFVTSYLGMNTSDIRDMDNKQTLFWEIAIPLTVAVMGTILFIAYNGDELRDPIASIYRSLTGKQDRSTSARGISVAQRKRAAKAPALDSSSTLDYKSLADEAEYATPRPDFWGDKSTHWGMTPAQLPNTLAPETNKTAIEPMTYAAAEEEFRPRISGRNRRTPTTYSLPINTKSSIRVNPPYLASQPAQPFAAADPIAQRRAQAPTYLRIARAYLDPQTLTTYNLPWENDPQDPDYIIVKQYLDSRETDVLFEHTKRLREGRGRMDGGGGRSGRGEYVWVNKKKSGRGRRVGRSRRGDMLDL